MHTNLEILVVEISSRTMPSIFYSKNNKHIYMFNGMTYVTAMSIAIMANGLIMAI